ncbi:M16 family metallopeptidase [Pseudoduganella violaceinigra]|uniref:M16 family metallopeptidase n=1 Tax=Pseudoduganella violaceinigra TaxID=246602 RepID=UPI0006866EC0|nr:M16 family metallopeptidase [Pseudoduganella violaceinigra]
MKSLKLLLAAALAACSFVASAAPDPAALLPLDPQIRMGKLANGLTYYIQQNRRPEKRVELRLVVRAGSVLEDEDQLGLAHFTEHMAFNGSTHFKRHELVSWLQSVGVKFGADLNAYTGFDETVYMLPLPVDRKENLDKGLLVLEDWAQGVTFNDADIESERGIVQEELRLGKGATDRMNKVLLPKLFNGSLYASRLPIGKADVLASFKPAAIRRFYKDWYRPDLMAVMVVGDIDPNEAERLVASHFSKLVNPAKPRPRLYPAIPERKQSEAVVVTDREAPSNAVTIRYPFVQRSEAKTVGEYRQNMVESLSAAMLSQRIAELSQQTNAPFMQGFSSMATAVHGYRAFVSSAVVGKAGALPAIVALVEEGERARQLGFSAAELERAKKNMTRFIENLYSERDKTESALYVGEFTRHFLDGESMPGIENEYNYYKDLLPGVTLEEVNAQVRSAIPVGQKKLIIFMGNDKSGTVVPQAEQMLATVEEAEKATVAAHAEKALAASLMARPPKPGHIVKESADKALGTTELLLSNGVKVILKPTDFKNDEVMMTSTRFGGQSLAEEADIVNARYASAILASMGVKDYTPLDMQKILAGRSVRSAYAIGAFTEGYGGGSSSADVETLLQLVYLQMTEPRRDQALFDVFIDKQQEQARNALARPDAVLTDTVRTAIYGNHPRVGLTPRPEELDGIRLERVMALHRERLASAYGMTFIFVGSFDPAKIKPLLATYLGGLPAPKIATEYRDRNVRPVRGVVKKEVRRGREQKSQVSISFTGAAAFSELEQMRLRALVEIMQIKATEALREQRGLVYAASIGGGMSRHPYASYSIQIGLPTAPENVDKAIEATFAEVRKLQEKGPEAADLAKVKENWTSNYRKALHENAWWLAGLQQSIVNKTDARMLLRQNDLIAGLTAADVQAAARRYFDFGNYVQVVLQPAEGKSGAKAEAPAEAGKLPLAD